MIKYLILILQIINLKIIPSLSSFLSDDDYCDKNKFCELAPGPHIKCNNTGAFGVDCPDNVELVILNEYVRNEIVIKHNEYRNMIASGNLKGYKSADRMAKMSWCNDLAELAKLNVITCIFKHDDCRNTNKFPYSGQNLGIWINSVEMETNGNSSLQWVSKIIDDWFNEYKNANMSLIEKFRLPKEPIGHFTVIVAAKNNCVGCSMVKYTKARTNYILIACNYAWTNIFEFPVYKSGKIGSKCQSGTDKLYSGLCNSKEIYSQDPGKD